MLELNKGSERKENNENSNRVLVVNKTDERKMEPSSTMSRSRIYREYERQKSMKKSK